MASFRRTKLSPEPNHRAEYEQREFQRLNPHLYTTLNQSVNPDGSITTFEDVTKTIRYHLERLKEIQVEQGANPEFWWLYASKEIQDMHDYLLRQLDKCRRGFVRNYKNMIGDQK